MEYNVYLPIIVTGGKMTELHVWKCDVCGDEHRYEDGSWNRAKNSYEIEIAINHCLFDNKSDKFIYLDVCEKCHRRFLDHVYSFQKVPTEAKS